MLPPPLPLFLFLLKMLPLLASSYLVNPPDISANNQFSSPLFLLSYALLCFGSDPPDPIRSVRSDPTRSDLTFLLFFFNSLTLLFFDCLYSANSNPNPICSPPPSLSFSFSSKCCPSLPPHISSTLRTFPQTTNSPLRSSCSHMLCSVLGLILLIRSDLFALIRPDPI